MSISLDGKLVVAISSRALFDFEEENQVFEQGDDRAYMNLQLDRLETPAKPGVAFSLVQKLLAFNTSEAQRVEVHPRSIALALFAPTQRQLVFVYAFVRCAFGTRCRRSCRTGVSALGPRLRSQPTRSTHCL